MLVVIVIIIVVVLILGLLIWYYSSQKTTPPKYSTSPKYSTPKYSNRLFNYKSSKSNNDKVYSNNINTSNNTSGMGESSYYHPLTSDQPSIVETENKLLAMNRKTPPHPQFIFNSILRDNGNPIAGDLVIVPRETGISVPLNGTPDDLQAGYFRRENLYKSI